MRVEDVVRAVETVVGNHVRPIALHEPTFAGNEWSYVKECLDTGWVSSVGSYVDRFERDLGAFVGGYAVAVVNGTAALQVSVRLADVKPGDEVLVPALSFVATANAVVYCGAVPHFVDSDAISLGVDPLALTDYLRDIGEIKDGVCRNKKTGRRMAALLPMHTYGHPVDLDPLMELAARYKFALIEDAAESLGSYYKGRHTGSIGAIGALSFNGNKVLTTGGGGAIVSQDKSVAAHAKHLTTTARLPHRWGFAHDEVGYNYRMPNINAALGCAQLEQLPAWVERKRALAAKYSRVFDGVAGVRAMAEPSFARSNYWLNILLLNEPSSECRDAILEQTNARGIQTRPVWDLLSELAIFQECPRMPMSGSKDLAQRIVCLPSSQKLAS